VLRGRAKVLLDREDELAQIAAFATGSDDAFGRDTARGGYLWLVGGPWAGKTALLAEAVHTMPDPVDVVAFFLVAREGRASRAEFLAAVVPQLAWILDRDLPAAMNVDAFNQLWELAAQQADAKGRHLLLVVDGLDEDLQPDRLSVAELLPAQHLGRHARVLVASRPYPQLPSGVPANHPLVTSKPVRLRDSPHATELQVLAEQEIDLLLTSGAPRDLGPDFVFDVLGVLTAAAGPLSVEDLASPELVNKKPWIIRDFVTNRAARSLEPVGPVSDRRYQFAHQTLLERCRQHPDVGGDPQYRNRLNAWANRWHDERWPAPGTDGPGTPRYLIDAYPAALAGDPTDPTGRPADPRRLTALGSDMGWVDNAVWCVGVDRALAVLRTAVQLSLAQAQFLPSATDLPSMEPVERLIRLLDRTAHRLRPPYPVNELGYIPRELALGALAAGDDDLADGARQRLAELPYPQLLPLWTATQFSNTLVRTLTGHEGTVLAVAVNADGTRAVSGSGDSSVRVWDLAGGKQSERLTGHEGEVRGVAISADGTRAVSGGDRSVRVWNLLSGQQLHRLDGHEDWVNAVAVSVDGTRAVSGANDRTVRVWDTTTGQQLHHLTGHEGEVLGVAISGDGTRAVSGAKDRTVRVWDTTTGQQLHHLTGHEGEVLGVAISGDGTRAVSGAKDRTVRVWDTTTGQQLHHLTGHESWVRAVAVAQGTRAVSGSDDRSVRVWDLATSQQPERLAGHGGEVLGVAISADGRRAISGGRDRSVRLWDAATGQQLHRLMGHKGIVLTVAIDTDGTRAVSGSDDGSVRVWDLTAGQQLHRLTGHSGWVRGVAISADGRRAVTGGDLSVRVWDLTAGQQLHRLDGHDREVLAVAVSPDGLRAVSGSKDGNVLVWDTTTGRLLLHLTGHEGWVRAVAVSADGTRVVSGGNDRTVLVWDLASGRQLHRLTGHEGWVRAVAVSADGTRAVTGSDEGTVSGRDEGTLRMWDLTRGEGVAVWWFSRSVTGVAGAIAKATSVKLVSGDRSGAVTLYVIPHPGQGNRLDR
jgi:WD40 repeat protein